MRRGRGSTRGQIFFLQIWILRISSNLELASWTATVVSLHVFKKFCILPTHAWNTLRVVVVRGPLVVASFR